MVSITGAGNMLFVGISLQNSVRRGAPKCNLKYGAEGRATCPALYIIESHNIQYTKVSSNFQERRNRLPIQTRFLQLQNLSLPSAT